MDVRDERQQGTGVEEAVTILERALVAHRRGKQQRVDGDDMSTIIPFSSGPASPDTLQGCRLQTSKCLTAQRPAQQQSLTDRSCQLDCWY